MRKRGENMQPIIGITPSINSEENTYALNVAHSEVIERLGGIPFILPYIKRERDFQKIANYIDALYVTGGEDINPHYFNEEPHPALGQINPQRDLFERNLIRSILAMNKPILGICRGCQMLNVALGGSMYQDLAQQKLTHLIQHKQRRPMHYVSHFITLDEQSLLYRIIGKRTIKVNSFHHQANRILGEHILVSATSSDGVIEAIESKKHPFVIGVQWHPEQLIKLKDQPSVKLYSAFIRAACSQREESLKNT